MVLAKIHRRPDKDGTRRRRTEKWSESDLVDSPPAGEARPAPTERPNSKLVTCGCNDRDDIKDKDKVVK